MASPMLLSNPSNTSADISFQNFINRTDYSLNKPQKKKGYAPVVSSPLSPLFYWFGSKKGHEISNNKRKRLVMVDYSSLYV